MLKQELRSRALPHGIRCCGVGALHGLPPHPGALESTQFVQGHAGYEGVGTSLASRRMSIPPHTHTPAMPAWLGCNTRLGLTEPSVLLSQDKLPSPTPPGM